MIVRSANCFVFQIERKMIIDNLFDISKVAGQKPKQSYWRID